MESLYRKEFVEVNGARLGIFTVEAASDKPVLLYVHGGPGEPKYLTLHGIGLDAHLREHFTVCYPDERGAGMSYSPDVYDDSFTMSQFIDDIAAIARLLMERYQKPKIYLFGHSFGSALALQAAERYPELFECCIVGGFVGDQFISEGIAHNFFVQKAFADGDHHLVLSLARQSPTLEYLTSLEWLQLRTTLMARWHVGLSHLDLEAETELDDYFATSDLYTEHEKANYETALVSSLKRLWPAFVATGNTKVTALEVPLHVFQGVYDFQTAFATAFVQFERTAAPAKSFVVFERSAHSMMVDEPQKFVAELVRIAHGS